MEGVKNVRRGVVGGGSCEGVGMFQPAHLPGPGEMYCACTTTSCERMMR